MSLSVAELDGMAPERAAAELGSCCGALRWVRRMIARRPFGTRATVLVAADAVWREMEPVDWLEAFSHHPRIGERVAARSATARAVQWSSVEQATVASADDAMRAAIEQGNRDYEDRFGFTYIVCATGKTPAELLTLLRARLRNDREAELRVAADEQRLITRLRLEKLLRVD